MAPTTNGNGREAPKTEPEASYADGENVQGTDEHRQLSTSIDFHGNSLVEDESNEISDAGRRAMLEYIESFVEELISGEIQDEDHTTIAINQLSSEEEMASSGEEMSSTDGNEFFEIVIVAEYEEKFYYEPYWEIYIIVAMIVGITLPAIYYFPDI